MKTSQGITPIVCSLGLTAAGLIMSGCSARPIQRARPVVVLTNSAGEPTADFAPLDIVRAAFSHLAPDTAYDVRVVRSDGRELSRASFTSDRRGIIPTSVLWWDIGVEYGSSRTGKLNLIRVSEYTYVCELLRKGKPVIRAPIRVQPLGKTPVIYSSDRAGNPLNGFAHRKEDVYVTGKNFPPGSRLRVYAVRDQYTWQPGDPLEPVRKEPLIVQLEERQREFTQLLWPGGETRVGSYDIIIEPESANGVFDWRDPIDSHYGVGFTIFTLGPSPAPPGPPAHVEAELACQAPPQDNNGNVIGAPNPIYKDVFSPQEEVWVAVNPYAGGGNYVGQSAKLYVVNHKPESGWTDGVALTDVSGGAESAVIQPGCANVNYHRVWSNPPVGDYDVVVDFAPFDVYNQGQDIIDSLDKKGFVVPVEWVCLESVSFNHDSAATTSDALNIRMDKTEDVVVPEWQKAKQNYPAAYVVGKNITVKAEFSAAPGVNTCTLRADVGYGSLGAVQAATVTFTAGNPNKGVAQFTVAGPTPGMIKMFDQKWDWYCEAVNGTAVAPMHLGSSKDRIYLVLAQPQNPWSTSGPSKPWAQALQRSCVWASGQTTAAGAAEKITHYLFQNVGGTYDNSGGAPHYPVGAWGKGPTFAMTSFLNNIPNVSTVNCYDMGKSLVSFSNVVGSNLNYRYSEPFGYLNCILPIGLPWTNDPFGGPPPIKPEDSARTDFGNHAFGSISDNIFDACMKVDSDSNPDYGPPFTETWLTNVVWPTYRTMTVDDNPATSTGYPSTHPLAVE